MHEIESFSSLNTFKFKLLLISLLIHAIKEFEVLFIISLTYFLFISNSYISLSVFCYMVIGLCWLLHVEILITYQHMITTWHYLILYNVAMLNIAFLLILICVNHIIYKYNYFIFSNTTSIVFFLYFKLFYILASYIHLRYSSYILGDLLTYFL